MVLFDLAKIKATIDKLEAEQNEPNFWNDQKHAVKVVNELNNNKDIYNSFNNIKNNFKDLSDLLKSLKDGDRDMLSLANEIYASLIKEVDEMRIKVLFNGEFDNLNAIIDIHPGAGGTEAMDWANMLYRMYTRWAEKRGFSIEIIDYLDGDEAGIKSITFQRGKLTDVWIEEATEITQADFEIIDDRLRGELPEGLFYQIKMTYHISFLNTHV